MSLEDHREQTKTKHIMKIMSNKEDSNYRQEKRSLGNATTIMLSLTNYETFTANYAPSLQKFIENYISFQVIAVHY